MLTMLRSHVPAAAVLAALAGFALSACDGSPSLSATGHSGTPTQATSSRPPAAASPSAPVQVPGAVGYLFAGNGDVTFLQWRDEVNGTFSGTALGAVASGTPPDETVSTGSGPIDGQVNGSAVTLDIQGHTDQGVLSGNSMILNVVQTDGSIRPFTYQRASPADYNTALDQLQHSVQSANQQAQQQQNQSDLTSAGAEATGTLQSDNATFGNAKNLRDDLAKADTDLAKERQDAANGDGPNCNNIDSVVYNDAAYVVGLDVTETALNDTSTEQFQLNGIRGDIAAVQNTQAALKAAGLPRPPAPTARSLPPSSTWHRP